VKKVIKKKFPEYENDVVDAVTKTTFRKIKIDRLQASITTKHLCKKFIMKNFHYMILFIMGVLFLLHADYLTKKSVSKNIDESGSQNKKKEKT
jgi:hypothetical protein